MEKKGGGGQTSPRVFISKHLQADLLNDGPELCCVMVLLHLARVGDLNGSENLIKHLNDSCEVTRKLFLFYFIFWDLPSVRKLVFTSASVNSYGFETIYGSPNRTGVDTSSK